MDYTIEDVKRDLRRLKDNDLDPETEERLMEIYRRWCRGELPDLEEEPENETEHRWPGHD